LGMKPSRSMLKGVQALPLVVLLAMVAMVGAAQTNAKASSGQRSLPRSEQFPASVSARGPGVTAGKRDENRTSAQNATDNEIPKLPNFAARYALQRWRCGSDCTGIRIVDLDNGKRYGTPFVGVRACPADKTEIFTYRVNSRLLVIKGSVERSDEEEDWPCGTLYYEWTGTTFRLIRFDKGR
jgi:hypothetical protein